MKMVQQLRPVTLFENTSHFKPDLSSGFKSSHSTLTFALHLIDLQAPTNKGWHHHAGNVFLIRDPLSIELPGCCILVSDRRRAGKIKSTVHVRRHLPATGPQSDLTRPLSTSRTSSMVYFSVHFNNILCVFLQHTVYCTCSEWKYSFHVRTVVIGRTLDWQPETATQSARNISARFRDREIKTTSS